MVVGFVLPRPCLPLLMLFLGVLLEKADRERIKISDEKSRNHRWASRVGKSVRFSVSYTRALLLLDGMFN